MKPLDLVLLHAPSVYDFRQKAILYGPVADLIPSSSMFEMYPIGFASIAEYLEAAGYRVRIVNLAVRMLGLSSALTCTGWSVPTAPSRWPGWSRNTIPSPG